MKTTAFTFLCALSFTAVYPQFTNVLISPTGCTEPFICIDPLNPARAVAATNCTYSYYSADSGQSWALCNNTAITPGFWCYDPCIVADYNGNFFYFHNYESQPLPRKTVQKSVDGGQTWSSWSNVNGLYDKEMCCVRPSTNELYATYIPLIGLYNVGFSKSSDAGVTWDTLTYVNSQTYSGYQWGAAPAVGTNLGELYVVWENSTGVYFQKSLDNGATWMTFDRNLRYWFNPGNQYNCMPSIATDLSPSAGSGNIYITWWELDANGTDTDIYFAKSTDQGTTWTITSIASDIITDQKWPQITIDQTTGYIYVVYYNQYGATTTYDIKMAFSTDNGNTFMSVPVSVSPATVTNWYHHYIGNSAVSGVIRPAWTTNDSLYTALLSQSQLTLWLGAQDFNTQSALNIFPNPSSGIFYLSSAGAGEITVQNSQGQKVHTQLSSAEQTTLDISNLPGGLYLVTLKTKDGTATQKIIKR
ncbi:MAG TPA: T9SS type A sorting domain-containing protein [Bacteroidia bacterium]|nr:T9SS type A sorting domain-containing protein [Bacteroidia bacterium]